MINNIVFEGVFKNLSDEEPSFQYKGYGKYIYKDLIWEGELCYSNGTCFLPIKGHGSFYDHISGKILKSDDFSNREGTLIYLDGSYFKGKLND
jgi:hypothetical protein